MSSNTIFITFRGEDDVAIKYTYGGYEEDTNTEDINWSFVDSKFKDITLTEVESDYIDNKCLEHTREYSYED